MELVTLFLKWRYGVIMLLVFIKEIGGGKMIEVKLRKIIEERGISQKQLVEMTGIRPNTISEIVNNQRSTINREHLAIICKALEITSMDEIFELK